MRTKLAGLLKKNGIHTRTMENPKQYCDEVGVKFISSPFSSDAVNLIEEVSVQKYKIGSGKMTNYLMLAKTGKYYTFFANEWL